MEKLSISGEIRSVYTLFELTNSIVSVINKNYKSSYWIKAEVTKLNYYPKTGHCYPDLVEKESGKIKAQLKGIIWAKDYIRIKSEFIRITGENLHDGIQILFLARLVFDPVHGLSLIIQNIEPSYTLGEMAREKQDTINKLKLEGVFNKNKMLKIPLLPRRLAIISVETSKGFADFISKLNEYKSHFTLFYKLYPSILQGDSAVESISQQLKLIKKAHKYYDAVLIIRGGGGDIGLSCYDNIRIAREIANFPVPVITGIGHSTNETVAEMVANKNLITPTDVAFYLLGMFESFAQQIEINANKILENTNKILENTNKNINEICKLIISGSQKYVQKVTSNLELLKFRFSSSARSVIQHNYFIIKQLIENIRIYPNSTINKKKQYLSMYMSNLSTLTPAIIKKKNINLQHFADKTRLLDPVNVLKRGYSITYYNGKSLRKVNNVKAGDEIRTRLMQGELTSIIMKTKKINNE